MRPWADIDWKASRPESEDIADSRARVRFEVVNLAGEAIDRVLDELAKTHINGGGLAARIRLACDDDVLHWFASRNRFVEYDFFPVLLGSQAIREALPTLNVPRPLRHDLGFEESWSGTLTLDGEIAATLVKGGAYKCFQGGANQAKRLGAAFADAVVSGRHEAFRVYRSSTAWSPWFCDIAWDNTWACIDMDRNEVVVLCVTDAD
jgi:hypothetical protein